MEAEKDLISKKEAQDRGLKRYFSGIPCKHGHIDERAVNGDACQSCIKERVERYRESYSARRKDFYDANRERLTREKREWNKKNRDLLRQRKQSDRDKNIEKYRERWRAYREKNREKVRQTKRLYQEKRMRDPLYALKRKTRTLVRNSFNNLSLSKNTKTVSILGCSFEDFKIHIEKQFLPGMTWDNRSKWHIDHIVPLATAKTEADVIALNHFTNLRPLWAIDNLKKGSKLEYLL